MNPKADLSPEEAGRPFCYMTKGVTMYMKQHILAALREEFSAWEGAIAGIPLHQRALPLTPSAWSLKDELAHLNAWQQRTIARLEAAQHQREPEFPPGCRTWTQKWKRIPSQSTPGSTNQTATNPGKPSTTAGVTDSCACWNWRRR